MNSYTVEELYRLAQNGNTEALVKLGVCYKEGNGVDRDESAAAQCFYSAAEAGNAAGQYQLGLCYEGGRGVEQDSQAAAYWYQEAAKRFYEAARLGNPQAQYGLANCYSEGRGVARDPEAAVYWYQASAQQDYADAQYNLGYCYLFGIGVEANDVVALKWYQSAASHGDPQMQHNLGLIYKNGYGSVSRNYGKAAEWFFKAARQGDSSSKMELALIYFRDPEAVKDVSVAERLMTEAAEDGITDAQVYLMHYYFDGSPAKRDMKKAYIWAAKTADQVKDPVIPVILGTCYAEGTIIGRDEALAADWLKLAAEQPESLTGEAAYYLGRYYQSGRNLPRSYEKASYFYELSQSKGCRLADEGLESLRLELEHQTAQDEAAKKAERKAQEEAYSAQAQQDLFDEEEAFESEADGVETEAAEQLEAGMDEAAESSLETEKPEAADEAVLAASEPGVQQSGKQPDAADQTDGQSAKTSAGNTFHNLKQQMEKNRRGIQETKEAETIFDEDDRMLIQAYEDSIRESEAETKTQTAKDMKDGVSASEVSEQTSDDELHSEAEEAERPDDGYEYADDADDDSEYNYEESDDADDWQEDGAEPDDREKDPDDAYDDGYADADDWDEAYDDTYSDSDDNYENSEDAYDDSDDSYGDPGEVYDDSEPYEDHYEESDEEASASPDLDETGSEDGEDADGDWEFPSTFNDRLQPVGAGLNASSARNGNQAEGARTPINLEKIPQLEDELQDYHDPEELDESDEDEDSDEWESSDDQFIASLLATGARVTRTAQAIPKKKPEPQESGTENPAESETEMDSDTARDQSAEAGTVSGISESGQPESDELPDDEPVGSDFGPLEDFGDGALSEVRVIRKAPEPEKAQADKNTAEADEPEPAAESVSADSEKQLDQGSDAKKQEASEPAEPEISEPAKPEISEPAEPEMSEPAEPEISEPALPEVSEAPEEKQKEDTAQQQTEDDLSESKPASDEASVSNPDEPEEAQELEETVPEGEADDAYEANTEPISRRLADRVSIYEVNVDLEDSDGSEHEDEEADAQAAEAEESEAQDQPEDSRMGLDEDSMWDEDSDGSEEDQPDGDYDGDDASDDQPDEDADEDQNDFDHGEEDWDKAEEPDEDFSARKPRVLPWFFVGAAATLAILAVIAAVLAASGKLPEQLQTMFRQEQSTDPGSPEQGNTSLSAETASQETENLESQPSSGSKEETENTSSDASAVTDPTTEPAQEESSAGSSYEESETETEKESELETESEIGAAELTEVEGESETETAESTETETESKAETAESTEVESESETETAESTETETESKAETAESTEVESESETETAESTETETESKAETAESTETETESKAETVESTEAETESETFKETESEAAEMTETETDSESESESERTEETETETESETEAISEVPEFSSLPYTEIEVPSSGCVYAKLGYYDEKDNMVFAGKPTLLPIPEVAETAQGMNVIGDYVYFYVLDGTVYMIPWAGGTLQAIAYGVDPSAQKFIMNYSVFAGNKEYRIEEDPYGSVWEGVGRFLTFDLDYAYYTTEDGQIGRAHYDRSGAEVLEIPVTGDSLVWAQVVSHYFLYYDADREMMYSYDLQDQTMTAIPFEGIEDCSGLAANGNWVYGIYKDQLVRVRPNGSGLETILDQPEDGSWTSVIHAMEHYLAVTRDGSNAGEYLVNVDTGECAQLVAWPEEETETDTEENSDH